MKSHWKQNSCALITAIIWGTAFVAQAIGADSVSPFTFTLARAFVATVFLAILLLVRNLVFRRNEPKPIRTKSQKKKLFLGGSFCGLMLMLATNLQQFGIKDSGAGKAAFITALYVVLIPIIGVFLRRKTSLSVWLAVVLAVCGLYFLCMSGGWSVSVSDLALLGSAFAYAGQILAVDYVSSETDGIELSCVQFATMFVFAIVPVLIFGEFRASELIEGALPILYVGVLSSGVAYTLQIFAQKDSNPTVISLILSMESFFSAVAEAVVLHRYLSPKEYFGCALMLAAVAVAQIPMPTRKKKAAPPESE